MSLLNNFNDQIYHLDLPILYMDRTLYWSSLRSLFMVRKSYTLFKKSTVNFLTMKSNGKVDRQTFLTIKNTGKSDRYIWWFKLFCKSHGRWTINNLERKQIQKWNLTNQWLTWNIHPIALYNSKNLYVFHCNSPFI